MKRKVSPVKGVTKSPAKSKLKSASAKSAAPAKPAKATKPAKAVKPAKASKTAKTAKAVKTSKTATPAKAAKPVKAATPAKTAKAAKTTKTATPVKSAKAVQTAKPASPVKSPAKKTSSEKSGLVKKVVKGFTAAFNKITGTKAKSNAKVAPKVEAKVATKAPSKPAPEVKAKTKTPVKTVRPKSFPAQPAEKSFGFPADVPELPESYGEDRLVLMTQDPEYLFTYWEITPEQRALSEQAKRDGEEYQEALRLNWTASDLFAPNFALLPVSLDARKGYLRVPVSGLSYQVEIGWLSDQGHFISILGRSNRSDAPESWKQTRERLKSASTGERTVLEYNLDITEPLGSSELGKRFEGEARTRTFGPGGDFGFEGPGSLSSSASSGSVVKKTSR